MINQQPTWFSKALAHALYRTKYGTRWRAIWRALRGLNDGPNQLPERFLNINFLSKYQADIVRHLWREHHSKGSEFVGIFQGMGPQTWAPKMDRYIMLWQALRSVLHLPGAIAEFGVYKGATARLIAQTMKQAGVEKKLYLLDTFAGLPEPAPDLDAEWKRGDLGDTTLAEVQSYLADVRNAIFLPGLFADNFRHIENERFCFSHVDCDLYASVKECCDFLYSHTVSGGYIFFDDYGIPYCPGAKLAVDQFFADKPEPLIYLPTGQCFVVRL